MILVDSRIGSFELIPLIKKLGVECQESLLEYGDAYFEGIWNGERINVGVERKTLHDMLSCIDTARYVSHQMPGMGAMYDRSFLIIEGQWAPSQDGILLEGKPRKNGSFWEPIKYRTNRVEYAKLRRYLFSISLSGVVVLYTSCMRHTAHDICEIYHYFQKKQHTALLEIHKLALPDMRIKPSLCRRWASSLTDIGVKLSLDAEKMFKTGLQLAKADELAWMRIKGVSPKMAAQIVKEIRED